MITNLEWLFRIEKIKNSKNQNKPKRGAVLGFDGIGGANTEKQLQLFKKNKLRVIGSSGSKSRI